LSLLWSSLTEGSWSAVTSFALVHSQPTTLPFGTVRRGARLIPDTSAHPDPLSRSTRWSLRRTVLSTPVAALGRMVSPCFATTYCCHFQKATLDFTIVSDQLFIPSV